MVPVSASAAASGIEEQQKHIASEETTIPYGRYIELSVHGVKPQLSIATSTNSLYANEREAVPFLVIYRGKSQVTLLGNGGFISVDPAGIVSLRRGLPDRAGTFLWVNDGAGELELRSLNSQQYLRVDSVTGAIWANAPMPSESGMAEIQFDWKLVTMNPDSLHQEEPKQ